ncbi:MAG: GNAT family N-acetyltransferase [Clostridium sp.]
MEDLQRCLKLADSNLIYSIRNRVGHIEGGEFIDENGYVIFTVGADNLDGHLNGGICMDDSKAKEFLKKIKSVFNKQKRSYVIWVREHDNENLERLLQEKGLSPVREPGSALMVCTDKSDDAKLSDKFYIRYVRDNFQTDSMRKVIQDAFDKDDKIGEVMINLRMVSNPRAEGIVVYSKGTDEAVATGSLVLSDGIAGIYYVGTAKEHRGQGLGSYVAQEMTNLGLKAGASMMVLQASEAGEGIYKKLGYETISHYRCYRV